jgi:hypothetical protein
MVNLDLYLYHVFFPDFERGFWVFFLKSVALGRPQATVHWIHSRTETLWAWIYFVNKYTQPLGSLEIEE